MCMALIFILLIVATLSGCASLMMSVPVFFSKITQFHCLLHVHLLVSSLFLLHTSQGLTHLLNFIGLQIIRELDLEHNEEITVLVCLFMEGHTISIYGLNIIGFNDFTWSVCDPNLASIQVSQDKLNSGQGL